MTDDETTAVGAWTCSTDGVGVMGASAIALALTKVTPVVNHGRIETAMCKLPKPSCRTKCTNSSRTGLAHGSASEN